jgi:site-specific DNA-methyltransferase (adenine-specific)
LDLIVAAFAAVREGMSVDYVIACPEANRRFLERVLERGCSADVATINQTLLNARKAGRLKAQRNQRQYRLPPEMENWAFVSEWAMRHLQRELLRETYRLIALDEILCNPDYATHFDALAARIKPGFTPLDYRWAALSLRKKGKAKPEPQDLTVALDCSIPLGKVLEQSFSGPALYLIAAADRPLYVNDTDNLHEQLRRHAEIAGDRLVPDWLLDKVRPADTLSYTDFPQIDPDRLREYRITAIARYRPWLNLLETAGVL